MIRSSQSQTKPHSIVVGRDPERQQLRDLFGQTAAGQGSFALVTGEAGIGKTTLIEELIRYAVGHGALVLSGHCYDLTTTPPYGPWIEVTHSPVPDELPQLPDEIRSGNGLAGVDSKDALFDMMVGFLHSLARERPLIVVLEDMHWADSASLELLRFFARQLDQIPALLLVTWRDDEITRRHELYQLLPVLLRETPAERIQLQRLDAEAIAALVATRFDLGSYDELRLVNYLDRLGEGNPFFISELLQTLQDRRLMQNINDSWLLGELDDTRVPPVVRQVIESRLDRLQPETLQVLQLAAVIGQDVPVNLWAQLADLPDTAFDSAIAEALDAHLLAPAHGSESFSFSHALVREALYDQVMPTRRRGYHRRIGESLAGQPRPTPDTVAHHFQQAGDPRACEWHIRAGYRAERGYAWAMAARSYEAALPYLEADDSRRSERGWLLHHIGQLLSYSRTTQAAAYLEDALQIAIDVHDRALEAFSLADLGMAHGFGRRPGFIRQGIEELESGITALLQLTAEDIQDGVGKRESLFSSDPAWPLSDTTIDIEVTMRQGVLAYRLAHVGRYREAIQLGRTLESCERNYLDYPSRANGIHRSPYYGLADSYAAYGQVKEARQAYARARELAISSGNDVVGVSVSINEFRKLIVPFDGGNAKVRKRALDRLVDLLDRSTGILKAGDFGQSMYREIRFPEEVYRRYLDGDWESARPLAATQVAEYPGQRGQRSIYFQALLARQQGDVELAWECIYDVLPQGPETIPGDCEMFIATGAQRIAAELALDAGDIDLARSWIRAHERWIEWSGSVLGRSEGALLRARLHRETGETSHARRHGGRAVSLASDPRQPLALIAAQRFLGRLAIDGSRFERAEGFLQQSLDLAMACEIPHERAGTLLAFAELHAEQGRQAEARSVLMEVREICEAMGATLLLSQVRALEKVLDANQLLVRYPGGLSPREAEVLVLVAQGLTNAEVGNQLFISPRTVGHHLQSIYGKLGVSSRAAASSFAVEHGLSAFVADG